MSDSEEKTLSECWQNKTIDYENQKPVEKVDTLRFCLSQISYMKKSDSCSGNSWSLHSEELELKKNYVALMDDKNYVNNYAQAILSLNKGFKNESKKWKCGLEASSLKKYVQSETETPSTLKEDYGKLASLLKNSRSSEIIPQIAKVDQKENCDIAPDFDMFDEDSLFDNEAPVERENSIQSRKPNFASMEIPKELKRNHFEFEEPETVKIRPSYPSQNEAKPFHPRNSFDFSSRETSQSNGRGKEKPKRYPWERLRNNEEEAPKPSSFRTASHQLEIENMKKFGAGRGGEVKDLYGSKKRSLGSRGIKGKFVPPVRRDEESGPNGCYDSSESETGSRYSELMTDERLKNIDAKMVELIMNEIMDHGSPVTWDDIAGLELAKSTIQEIVVWPMLRPDIFTGLRGPPKGLLLFGPPGTGKTMIGKCIACQSKSTFFSISASSLTSKWVGEGEKMVRAMFAVAKCHQPSVIFIDEIDSLLTQRSDTEHESSRRLKTEFLVQLDGATSGDDERILVVGATNRPQELDEAARRRLVKRLYIPLPADVAKEQIIRNLLMNQSHTLSEEDIGNISKKAEGYSGADMANLCREAALGPIRSINFADMQHISVDQVRPITAEDFLAALRAIRASVSSQDLNLYEEWNKKYGINA